MTVLEIFAVSNNDKEIYQEYTVNSYKSIRKRQKPQWKKWAKDMEEKPRRLTHTGRNDNVQTR